MKLVGGATRDRSNSFMKHRSASTSTIAVRFCKSSRVSHRVVSACENRCACRDRDDASTCFRGRAARVGRPLAAPLSAQHCAIANSNSCEPRWSRRRSPITRPNNRRPIHRLQSPVPSAQTRRSPSPLSICLARSSTYAVTGEKGPAQRKKSVRIS